MQWAACLFWGDFLNNCWQCFCNFWFCGQNAMKVPYDLKYMGWWSGFCWLVQLWQWVTLGWLYVWFNLRLPWLAEIAAFAMNVSWQWYAKGAAKIDGAGNLGVNTMRLWGCDNVARDSLWTWNGARWMHEICNLGETCILVWMVNTGKLNMNDNQESEHKAHLRWNYNKCLTVQHDDSWLVGPQEGAHEVTKKENITCEL